VVIIDVMVFAALQWNGEESKQASAHHRVKSSQGFSSGKEGGSGYRSSELIARWRSGVWFDASSACCASKCDFDMLDLCVSENV